VGQNGKLFVFLKFRTMIADAEKLKESLQHLNEREGLLFKISNDPRTTRFGRFLRRYSLDELPQLVNVLKGEMALVGPRPPSLDEYELYTAEHQTRLAAKPGITGLWQVTARNDPSFTTALNLDRSYIEQWSPWLDLKILLKTMPVVLQGEGQ
jgi:lipopolysaccharide/colanic/teichoic acid biosynthesis glycosyltransferase